MVRQVYYNGDFVPESEAKISIYDSALMYGDMVFEMTRSFNKKQFKLREHLVRLYDSMRYLQIPFPMSIDEMESACYETIRINEPFFETDDEHRLMIDVTRGLLPIYSSNIQGIKAGVNVIIADYPLRWTVSNLAHLFDTGINLVPVSQRVIPAELLEPKVKNRSRIHYLMASLQASQYSGNDNWALMLDTDGFLAEGPGNNIFLVKDGVVYTPEGRNVLRGVSRAYVFDLCKQLNISCVEKNMNLYDLSVCDESFTTATPFCILPATKYNNQPIGTGKVGDITTKLLNLWSENVGVNIPEQIKNWKSKSTSTVNPYEFKK